MFKMQCVNGSASRTSWTNQLDGPAGWTSWMDQLDRPVLLFWSLGQFAYWKIDLSVCTLSQLLSPMKALFTKEWNFPLWLELQAPEEPKILLNWSTLFRLKKWIISKEEFFKCSIEIIVSVSCWKSLESQLDIFCFTKKNTKYLFLFYNCTKKTFS